MKKKVGQYHVEVENDRISIVGDYGSNFGRFYTHNVTRYLNHPKGEYYDWNRPQVIAMDWDYGLTPKVKAFLRSLVDNGTIQQKD